MKILYLVPHVPNPTKARSHYHIRGLVEAGQQVSVATLAQSRSDLQQVEKLRALGIPVISATLSKAQLLQNALTAVVRGLPLQSTLMWSTSLLKSIQAYLHVDPPDLIHVEHLRMAHYGLALKGTIPTVWDAVDHLATLFQQTAQTSISWMWRLVARFDAPRLARYEAWLTSQFPLTLVISPADQAFFQMQNPYAHRVEVALPGLPVDNYGTPLPRQPQMLIFTGNLNYHPNVAAVHYFVEQIWPLIRSAHPESHLQLVGAYPVESVRALARTYAKEITITGFVPSLTDYLRQATVALAPITYAAGMQNKVLEAFITATPLVATSLALRGLAVQPDQQVLIGDTPEDFAAQVIRLLENPTLCQLIGEAGRSYVEEHHALTRTTQRLLDFYRQVIESR